MRRVPALCHAQYEKERIMAILKLAAPDISEEGNPVVVR